MTSEICSRVNPRRGADSTSIEEEGEPVLDSTNAPDIAVVFWELLWHVDASEAKLQFSVVCGLREIVKVDEIYLKTETSSEIGGYEMQSGIERGQKLRSFGALMQCA
ncbi:unnamed protein product [Sphagnum jensenii]|uniref:Uncharacterized protein n=1 Tax=Sphagnum jensenii TaxID=128206 RepID=A0ABP1B8N1_9BRYO